MSSDSTPYDDEIAALHAEIASDPLDDAEAFRVRYLGRKSGAVGALMGRMGEAPPETRRALGQKLNALKAAAEARLAEATEQAASAPVAAVDADGRPLDLTLPGRVPAPDAPGGLHVLTSTLADILGIFRAFGFSVERGPEIEDDWHNFTALHFPPDHPARDMQDTFFLEPPPPDGRGILLRTHTSPVQVRVMEREKPPIRVVAPGRVYRNEAISYKSFCLFHQVEGLVVDEGVSFADLKAMLTAFAEAFFGREVSMRFRPSFFPFTEVSAEVDVWWDTAAGAAGVRTGADGRWMEILGSGMVDPAVLENVGIDAERYTGYAFGMGVERLAMLRHGIADIRLLYENDLRFLTQF